jgi:hypothetical protein
LTGLEEEPSRPESEVGYARVMRAQIGPIYDPDLYDVPSRGLAQQVTGIQVEPASGHVFLKDAGFRSIQRLVLADANGGVVAGLMPGELKANALFLYSDHRAEEFLSAAEESGWVVRPTPHIGFYGSPPRQRLYLAPSIDLAQYVELWEGPARGRIGGYMPDDLSSDVWPWLKDKGLATADDDPVFEEFLRLLTSKRQAHLRAGLNAKRDGHIRR